MILKKQFISLLSYELNCVKHLHSKIDPKTLDYKPTEKQWSMLELLQYIAVATEAGTRAVLEEKKELFRDYIEQSKDVTLDNFIDYIEKTKKVVTDNLLAIDTESLEKEIDLWNSGYPQSKSSMLLTMVYRQLVGYKMQLFLYIKANGNFDINSTDLWWSGLGVFDEE